MNPKLWGSARLDVREYNLIPDFKKTIEAVELLEIELETAGSEGYYVISERMQLQDLSRKVMQAENLYSQEKYDECYYLLRNAYLEAFFRP